ncbi:sulfatase [Labilibacter sediminis]|nr:sulfatase [Labilibacter sediminis]
MKSLIKIIAVAVLAFSIVTQLKAKEKPNVIMIVLDDLNDYVGVMGGHPQAQTPNIDKLAKEGVLFTNAHSNCPVCMPSRASFMTGVAPQTSLNWGFNNWLKNEVLINSKTLPEYLNENGYNTYQSGKVLHNTKPGAWDEMGVYADYGPLAYNGKKTVAHPSNPKQMAELGALDATFAPLSDVPSVPATANAPGYTGWYNSKWGNQTPFHYASSTDRDKMTDEKSVDWFKNKMTQLERSDSDEPFFIGVGFIRPHTPLVVPQKYFDMFPLDEVKIPVYKENDKDDCKLSANTLNKDPRGRTAFKGLIQGYSTPEEGLRRYIQAYLASVAFADDMVGGVMNSINNSKFKDNTIVILFSDHGYNMGEKDYLFKYCLWEETTRVPLLIRHPEYAKHAGSKVDHPVSLIDIYPTIKDFCELEGSTLINDKGAELDGHSLKPFMVNPQTKAWEGPELALTIISSWKSKNPAEQHLSVRSKDFRYIHYGNGAEELYDHRVDEYEWDNLADLPEYATIKKQLKEQMFNLLKKENKPSQSVNEDRKKPTPSFNDKKTGGEIWKDKYFKMNPEADTDKDGKLSWSEYKAHKEE